jgi:DnaJ-class molecular chaperone
MFTDYTHTATGCGETLNESFEDAMSQLAEQGITFPVNGFCAEINVVDALKEQVKKPEMLDLDIVVTNCDVKGMHREECSTCGGTGTIDDMDGDECTDDCDDCDGTGEVSETDPDCAVCTGDWHFYVSIDVQVREEIINASEPHTVSGPTAEPWCAVCNRPVSRCLCTKEGQ